MQEALDQTVLIREGGVERRVTRRTAVVLNLVAKALTGDVRVATLLASIEQRTDPSKQAVPDETLSSEEAAVLDSFKARLREQVGQPPKVKDPDQEPEP